MNVINERIHSTVMYSHTVRLRFKNNYTCHGEIDGNEEIGSVRKFVRKNCIKIL
jgi:hypothetical protein